MKRKNIVVTGATGFIGGELVTFLKKQTNVSLKTFDKKKHSLQNISSLVSLIKGADIVYHLAGVTESGADNIFEVNLQGTVNIARAIRLQKKICDLLFASTLSVYKPPKKNQEVSEAFPISPSTNYGISKYLAEEALKVFSDGTNMRSTILRISNPYGPTMQPFKHSAIATFIALAKKNMPITLHGNGEQTRDFIYIDDVVSGLWKAASHTRKAPILTLNLATGKETTLNHAIKLIEKHSGQLLTKKHIKRTGGPVSFWNINTEKSRDVLGWNPTISIEQGIKKTWEAL